MVWLRSAVELLSGQPQALQLEWVTKGSEQGPRAGEALALCLPGEGEKPFAQATAPHYKLKN